jgi:hypothetical protein
MSIYILPNKFQKFYKKVQTTTGCAFAFEKLQQAV